MIDVEPLIVAGLDRLVPLPSGERADWQDVLGRAGETRRRRWLGVPRPSTWSRLQIAIVVIVVGLLLAAAATATYLAIYADGPSKRLVIGQVVRLRDGRISTHLLGTNLSFENPYGLGFQADKTQFVVGDSAGGLQKRRQSDFAVGVSGIDLPLRQAALRLGRTPGVRVLSVDKGEIFGGHPGPYPRLNGQPSHLYRLQLSRPKLHDIFGIPAQSFSGRTQQSWPIHPDMGARERHVDVVLIGAANKTFLVRFGNATGGLDPPDWVLGSLTFQNVPSKRLTIGQVVKLRHGVDSTHLLGTKVSFEGSWLGYGFRADETQFVVGDSPRGLQQLTGPHFAIGVKGIGLPLKQAAFQLEHAAGFRVLSVDKGEIFGHGPRVGYPRLGGHPAHLYRLLLNRPKLHEIFGIPAQSFWGVYDRVRTPPIGAHERRVDVVLIGAPGKTFLVRFGNQHQGLDAPYLVLMSLRFRNKT